MSEVDDTSKCGGTVGQEVIRGWDYEEPEKIQGQKDE
jgi:hypothetical protein